MVGMLYERRHTFAISEFGGLKTVMPWYAAFFVMVCLSSIAVPGFNGFVGEFLILMGSWSFNWKLVACASLGVILAAAYILWMVQRVLYGTVTNPHNATLHDLTPRELVVLVPLLALSLFMGVASPLFTRAMEPAVQTVVQRVKGASVEKGVAPSVMSRQQAPAARPQPPRVAQAGGEVR